MSVSLARPGVRRVALPPTARLLLLAALALLAIAAFMTLDARGSWDFILPFRGRKVIALAVVGIAVATSTVLFQAITDNRILTPSIMGFDALYLLVQTTLVFLFGSHWLVTLDPQLRFLGNVAALTLFAGLLFWWLFLRAERGLYLLLLVGIIFGVLFRSLTNLLERLIDPTEFAVLQDLAFASFNAVDQTLLATGTLLVGATACAAWRMHHELDTLALGRETAISLGVEYQRAVARILVLVTVLVATSTALVGPITFFGLLVAHLAYRTIGSPWYRDILPAAALLAIITLVGGQALLEHVFAFNTGLSVIVEFVGGATLLVLLLRGDRR
ncbi:MAG: iron chelate uptake ABC transporter family permease subunit [Thermomicrobiales bacterium]|nr:iron chelate uptake ABC transporter family permease subunit [Thermomicrobiales bacterium]